MEKQNLFLYGKEEQLGGRQVRELATALINPLTAYGMTRLCSGRRA